MMNNLQQNVSYPRYNPYQLYNPNIVQPQVQSYNQNFNQDTNITFVNGIEGAKAFQLRPNQSILLMDSENKKFYVKSSDNLGIMKISSYTFTEDEILGDNNTSSQNNNDKQYVSIEDFNSLKMKYDELNTNFAEIKTKLNDLRIFPVTEG